MHRERIYHFPLIKPFAVAFIAVTAMMLPVSEANAQVEPVIICSGRQVTSLSFSNPTLISGTDLQVGAVYRFSNVATAIDALVEITGFAVSYTHLRAHETVLELVCRLLLEKKK